MNLTPTSDVSHTLLEVFMPSIELPFEPSWIGNAQVRAAALRLLRAATSSELLNDRLDQLVPDPNVRPIVWAITTFAYGCLWQIFHRVTPTINAAIDVEIEVAEALRDWDTNIAALLNEGEVNHDTPTD
jgi:hypothetical protein